MFEIKNIQHTRRLLIKPQSTDPRKPPIYPIFGTIQLLSLTKCAGLYLYAVASLGNSIRETVQDFLKNLSKMTSSIVTLLPIKNKEKQQARTYKHKR